MKLPKILRSGHRPDYIIVATLFILTIFGLAMLGSASSELGQSKFNDSYYYLKHQIMNGLLLGILGFTVAFFFPYQKLRKIAFPLLLVSMVFLALVFTQFGLEARNTNRWVRFGPISFQPAEIMKLTFIIYLAAWLSNPKMQREKNFLEGLLPFFILSGFIAGLLLLQPATSTVVILVASALAIYFASGAEIKYLILFMLVGIAILGLIVYATPYRRARIMGYLHSTSDAEGQNYHINQALIAIGSGGVWGAGYGQSATKGGYLPTPTDDSIFAVIAEELGFVGAGGLVVLFAILSLRLFWLAKSMRDKFGRLMFIGFGTVIALQSFVNMAAISGLIPLTGVPLPFISYGGTALAVFLTMGGVASNISRYT